MKKLVSILLSLVMILSLSIGAFANENVTVKLNGETLVFDVQPQLIGGRTMVPLRKIFESLGAVVTWEESTSTVTAYNEFYIVKATIGNNTMYVNGEERWMDVPPMEVNSRTLVPARFVAEAFNCDISIHSLLPLSQIRNNFFIAVGLGNCMGFGQVFNKIISDFMMLSTYL